MWLYIKERSYTSDARYGDHESEHDGNSRTEREVILQWFSGCHGLRDILRVMHNRFVAESSTKTNLLSVVGLQTTVKNICA